MTLALIEQIIQLVGKFTEQTILKRNVNFKKEYKWPINALKNLLNILSYRRNENQNCTENPFHPCQNGFHQENNKCWWGYRERTFYMLLVEFKLVQPLWKWTWGFLFLKRQLKIKPPYGPAVPLLNIYQKELEAAYHRDTSHPSLLLH